MAENTTTPNGKVRHCPYCGDDMSGDRTKYSYKAIRDCGYGRVLSRLATDRDDAIAKAELWKHEGRSDGFINGGSFFIQPIREVKNLVGGFSSEPAGEAEVRP